MKSLSDLRAEPATVANERTLTVCLAPRMLAKVQRLNTELQSLPSTAEAAPSQAARITAAEREAAIYAELEAAVAEMAEHEGELLLQDKRTEGEWRQWCSEHPARRAPVRHPETGAIATDGEPGWQRDLEVADGRCNADALIDDLGTYVHAWNGEPLAAEDWAQTLGPKVGLPDKKAAASEVVDMYEVRRDFPQMRSFLSASLKKLSSSDSPAPSASVTSDSTAGLPDLSSEDSTETATG